MHAEGEQCLQGCVCVRVWVHVHVCTCVHAHPSGCESVGSSQVRLRMCSSTPESTGPVPVRPSQDWLWEQVHSQTFKA